MEATRHTTMRNVQDEEMLYNMLDQGIEDMEKGRELPLEQAYEKINELRKLRRNAKI